jgi:hypothetical protein
MMFVEYSMNSICVRLLFSQVDGYDDGDGIRDKDNVQFLAFFFCFFFAFFFLICREKKNKKKRRGKDYK